jgi:hypothetical protein
MEILNTGGAAIRRYSSTDPAPIVDVNMLAVNLAWSRAPEPLSAAAGMHRWVWDFRPDPPAGGRGRGGRGGGRGGPAPVATGTYSVRFTANGKTLTEPLTVRPDPRGK